MKRPLALSLAVLLLLSGCSSTEESTTIFAMDTVMTLTAYGSHAREGLSAAEAEINRLEKTLSVTREDSEVWAIDHSAGAPVTVGTDTAALLNAAAALGDRTGGALDVTLYPVVKAWGFTTGDYRIPDAEELADLLTRVDDHAVHMDGDTVTLPAGMELDFGALAKGYAGEQCASLLKEAGVTSAILNLGGNVQTVGAKPDGSPWRVAVQDPEGESEDYVGWLELTDEAAVTSGGYQRYFEENGVRYWHIIDPDTGAPARSGLLSATIVGKSGTACDGLSTGLFVLGPEKALDCWRQSDDFEAVLIGEDHTVQITAGLADRFTLREDSGYTLRIVEE
ncbi:FAD:protein FMN transferase [Candidatus Pseudoscillospira sp. SGI.172]|uniref:FAD:protein FMN transferase n=1 Tax=Candidatus Pseudoscillospira sp. SGI.172 TaxID=3420582 RepID=UPI0009BBF307|nr:FAD:protein FMN transferase [Pseudoflavonifractor sp.]MDY3020068.1 FAD:protein FMN transferase [Oscillospiraceae bacterium]